MIESAALLVDEVLPEVAMHLWGPSVPITLLFARPLRTRQRCF
jgi:hypothetical protein